MALVKASEVLSLTGPVQSKILLKIIEVKGSTQQPLIQYAVGADETQGIILQIYGGDRELEVGSVYLVSNFDINKEEKWLLLTPASKAIKAKTRICIPGEVDLPKLQGMELQRKIVTNVKHCVEQCTQSPTKKAKISKMTAIVTHVGDQRICTGRDGQQYPLKNVYISGNDDCSASIGLFRNLASTALVKGDIIEVTSLDGNVATGFNNFSTGNASQLMIVGRDLSFTAPSSSSASSMAKKFSFEIVEEVSTYAACTDLACTGKKLSVLDGANDSKKCDKCNKIYEAEDATAFGCRVKLVVGTEDGEMPTYTAFTQSVAKIVQLPAHFNESTISSSDLEKLLTDKIPDDEATKLFLEGYVTGKRNDVLTIEKVSIGAQDKQQKESQGSDESVTSLAAK